MLPCPIPRPDALGRRQPRCRGHARGVTAAEGLAKWHRSVLAPSHAAALAPPTLCTTPGSRGLALPWHGSGTGMPLAPGAGTARGHQAATHPHCTHGSVPSSWHRGRGASPAGLCKGTLGTAERLPRKTPCAAREQPVSCQGTGQSCSLVSLPRREHAGSGVTAPRRRPVECRIPKPTLNPGVPRLPPCQAPRRI